MAGKFIIHNKGGFSEKKGLIQFSNVVQITSLDERTRNKIYTAIEDIFTSIDEHDSRGLKDNFCEYLYEELLSLTKNHIPRSNDFYSYYDYGEVFENIYKIVLT